jgi:hypothetical protein
MSLSYTLFLTTEAGSPEHVREEIRALAVERGLAAANGTHSAPDDVVLASGQLVSVRRIERHLGTTHDDFGIDPALDVDFYVNQRAEPGDLDALLAQQEAEMVTIALALLDRLPGDAVLHREYDQVFLVRRDGRLVLSDDPDVWMDDLLPLVTQPYQRAALQFSGAG